MNIKRMLSWGLVMVLLGLTGCSIIPGTTEKSPPSSPSLSPLTQSSPSRKWLQSLSSHLKQTYKRNKDQQKRTQKMVLGYLFTAEGGMETYRELPVRQKKKLKGLRQFLRESNKFGGRRLLLLELSKNVEEKGGEWKNGLSQAEIDTILYLVRANFIHYTLLLPPIEVMETFFKDINNVRWTPRLKTLVRLTLCMLITQNLARAIEHRPRNHWIRNQMFGHMERILERWKSLLKRFQETFPEPVRLPLLSDDVHNSFVRILREEQANYARMEGKNPGKNALKIPYELTLGLTEQDQKREIRNSYVLGAESMVEDQEELALERYLKALLHLTNYRLLHVTRQITPHSDSLSRLRIQYFSRILNALQRIWR